MYHFFWDERKDGLNRRKHGIGFDEASSVFADERAVLFDDPLHSVEEDSFLLLGMSGLARACVVCHDCSDTEDIIRIISARKATKKEKERYAGGI